MFHALKPVSLDELKDEQPITSADIENLRRCGLRTIESILHSVNLGQVPGMNPAKMKRIVEKADELAREQMGHTEQAKMEFKKIKYPVRFSTGSQRLDELVKSDLATGGIIEVIGASKSGKTALCHTLAVTCQLPIEQKGAEGRCVYIDTEHRDLNPKRFADIIERYRPAAGECDLEAGIRWCHAYHLQELYRMLDAAKSLILDSRGRFALLILDSVNAVFKRAVLTEDATRAHLARLQEKLREFVDKLGIAVVVTNQKSPGDIYDDSLLRVGIDLDIPSKLSLSSDADGNYNCESTGMDSVNGCKVHQWRGRAPFSISRSGVGDVTK